VYIYIHRPQCILATCVCVCFSGGTLAGGHVCGKGVFGGVRKGVCDGGGSLRKGQSGLNERDGSLFLHSTHANFTQLMLILTSLNS
jgi:hypothetical protein